MRAQVRTSAHPALTRGTQAAHKVLLAAIFRFQRAQAGSLGLRAVGCGAVSFRQRAGDSLNLNPHLHVIVPDGVFTRCSDSAVDSVERGSVEDLERIVKRSHGGPRRPSNLLQPGKDLADKRLWPTRLCRRPEGRLSAAKPQRGSRNPSLGRSGKSLHGPRRLGAGR
ncbi:MAG: transposase [Deltaproteobacteria bacterium]|nr:transposase [Deltaproteobacteria bacterium]